MDPCQTFVEDLKKKFQKILLIHTTYEVLYIIHVKNIWIISWRQPYDTWHWWPGNPGWLGPCIPTILLVLVPIVICYILDHSSQQDYNLQLWSHPQVRQLHLLHVSSSHQLRSKVEVLTLGLEKSFFRARKGICWQNVMLLWFTCSRSRVMVLWAFFK